MPTWLLTVSASVRYAEQGPGRETTRLTVRARSTSQRIALRTVIKDGHMAHRYEEADYFSAEIKRIAFLDGLERERRRQVESAGRYVEAERRPSVCFRHGGWKPQRRLVAQALVRCKAPLARQSRFAECGSHAYVIRSVEDPTKYRIVGSTCKDRLCTPCALERARGIAANVLEFADGREIRFLTLTLASQSEDSLEDLITRLYNCFARLRRSRMWTEKVAGGIAFLEIKRSERSERWHPHLHCLIEGRFLEQKAIRHEWQRITTDSWIVDIRKPKDDRQAVQYVTKYASKPLNTSFSRDPDLLDEAVHSLSHRKLLCTFGTWRGFSATAQPIDGAWDYVAPLSIIYSSASAGDPEAIAILQAIKGTEWLEAAEKPPSNREERAKRGQTQQLFPGWSVPSLSY